MTARETGPPAPEGDRSELLRDDDHVPLQLSSSWDQAEAKLYPAVTTRPDLYQRVLTIVAHTVERLRGLGASTGALLAAADQRGGLVSDVMAEHGLSAHELDLDLLAQAALAMRHREVIVEQSARRRLELIAEGHRKGQQWVVVEESGFSEGDPFLPYQRLEVEVATGRTLLVTARGDDEFRAVLHDVEELRVDLTTGGLGEAPEGSAASASHSSAETREADAAARKQRSADA